jgi:hypothetical protein
VNRRNTIEVNYYVLAKDGHKQSAKYNEQTSAIDQVADDGIEATTNGHYGYATYARQQRPVEAKRDLAQVAISKTR